MGVGGNRVWVWAMSGGIRLETEWVTGFPSHEPHKVEPLKLCSEIHTWVPEPTRLRTTIFTGNPSSSRIRRWACRGREVSSF